MERVWRLLCHEQHEARKINEKINHGLRFRNGQSWHNDNSVVTLMCDYLVNSG